MAVEPGDATFKSKLGSDSKKKARDEIHEVESDIVSAVQTFRKWVLEQDAWLKSPTDIEFLLRFLRARKYSQVGARETLENYLANITEVSDWFANVDPAEPKVQELLKLGFYFSPMKLDKDNRRLIIARFGSIDADKLKNEYGARNLFRTMFLVANWMVRDEHCQVDGMKVLVDWSGVTFQHASTIFTHGNGKRFVNFYQNSLPKRLKGVNMYNEPPFFDAVFSFFSSFMKDKMKSRSVIRRRDRQKKRWEDNIKEWTGMDFASSTRAAEDRTRWKGIVSKSSVVPQRPSKIRLHGKNMANVYDAVDKSVLPDEYLPDDYTGPSAGPIRQVVDDMITDMMKPDYRDYITKLTGSTYGVYSSKKPKTKGDECVGSFRKLTVD